VPKKKSVKKAARSFVAHAEEVTKFLDSASPGLSEDYCSWVHDYAIIRLYRGFEQMISEALVGAVNNDTSTLAAKTGVRFPKHLTDEVCEYLITHGGYFDFRGRSGLIQQVERYVPKGHYVLAILKKSIYTAALDQLCSLRNFAAHSSSVSKARAKEALGVKNIGSAGSWLKKQGRLGKIVDSLKCLASDLEAGAPY
jgi:hypothetical protein